MFGKDWMRRDKVIDVEVEDWMPEKWGAEK